MLDSLTASLLRRHELRRSGDNAAASHAGIVDGSRESKVGQHRTIDVPFQQDVRRLDIAMNESLLMRSLQTASCLDADPQHFFRAERTVASNAILQRLAVHIRHDQERQPSRGIDRVNRQDMRMHDGCRCFGFAGKSFSGSQPRNDSLD